MAPLAWYERYGKRIKDTRLPQGQAGRDAYAQIGDEDGFQLLDALDAPETLADLRALSMIATLRQTWQRHYERSTGKMSIGKSNDLFHRRRAPPAQLAAQSCSSAGREPLGLSVHGARRRKRGRRRQTGSNVWDCLLRQGED